jgi:hypothetical protein
MILNGKLGEPKPFGEKNLIIRKKEHEVNMSEK